MLKNGRPHTTLPGGFVDDELITDMPKERRDKVLVWIATRLVVTKTPTYNSYYLKHRCEEETGVYTTNNQFKDAMLMCGIKPANPNEIDWVYCISKRSPVFKERNRKFREMLKGRI